MARDELRGGLPYPLSDEELDGLHMKESMRDSHRVRKFRRTKRFKPVDKTFRQPFHTGPVDIDLGE